MKAPPLKTATPAVGSVPRSRAPSFASSQSRPAGGPTKARTTIDAELIVVLLHDSMTVEAVDGLTERSVVSFMSANHLEPDAAAEIRVTGTGPSDAPGREHETGPAVDLVRR
jgi:hypothetical protein